MNIRYAVIEDGIVANIIIADDVIPGGIEMVLAETAEIGDLYRNGEFIRSEPPIPTERECIEAVQMHLDSKAAERGYDGILSACSYAGSSNSRFGPEGIACRDWRDSVWSHCYHVLSGVQAGTRQPPAISELLAELPLLHWPS